MPVDPISHGPQPKDLAATKAKQVSELCFSPSSLLTGFSLLGKHWPQSGRAPEQCVRVLSSCCPLLILQLSSCCPVAASLANPIYILLFPSCVLLLSCSRAGKLLCPPLVLLLPSWCPPAVLWPRSRTLLSPCCALATLANFVSTFCVLPLSSCWRTLERNGWP